MRLALQEFDYLRKLVYEMSFILIDPGKEYLAEARLGSLAHEQGCDSVQELLLSMRQCVAPASLRQHVLDAMTNNETWFFRDFTPFQILREQMLPPLFLRNAAQKQLTLWSAASSTGQEAYSIAMLLDEYFGGPPGWRIRILGTDISTAALERARKGRYSQMEVSRGLTPEYLKRYFEPVGTQWQISDAIRTRVEFRSLNLFESWDGVAPCDIIFLRNVLIYFDVEQKKQILAKVRSALSPEGCLFLGSAETTFCLDDSFERIASGPISYYKVKHP